MFQSAKKAEKFAKQGVKMEFLLKRSAFSCNVY